MKFYKPKVKSDYTNLELYFDDIEQEVEICEEIRQVLLICQLDIIETNGKEKAKKSDYLKLTNNIWQKIEHIRQYLKNKIEILEEGR